MLLMHWIILGSFHSQIRRSWVKVIMLSLALRFSFSAFINKANGHLQFLRIHGMNDLSVGLKLDCMLEKKTKAGACGFGEYGRTVYDGGVSGVSRLFRNGIGCGACYQVRCKVPQLCTEDGVRVVVTDYGEGDKTDFILSTRAYSRLARPNAALDLFAYGVVDIEYRRIPCQYPGYNLMVKVHEHSRFPEYLAVVMLYQAGQNDITAAEVWQADCQQWRGMRKAYGAVWDMANPPAGALNFRVQVSGSAGLKWVQLSSVIPSEWKAGAVYDTTIQLT